MPWSDQPRLELGSCHVSAPLRDAGEARTQVRPNVIPSDAPRQSDRQNPRTHAVYFVYVQTGQSQMKMQQNNCFADPSARFFGGVVDDAHVLRAKNRQRRGLAVQPARRSCALIPRTVALPDRDTLRFSAGRLQWVGGPPGCSLYSPRGVSGNLRV